MASTPNPSLLKYVNPYTPIAPKYSEGLNSIVATLAPLYPNQTIDDLVNAVYTYVTTTYSQTPSPIEEQNFKSLIYSLINGYLNYQLAYSTKQMDFIHKLIGGTLANGNPENILWHILDVEEQIAQSNLTTIEQSPLLYATAVGKAAYNYWSAVVTSPESWNDFITSFTPSIIKFPYWVASSMQGVLIGINLLNSVDDNIEKTLQTVFQLQGFEALASLYGSLSIGAGKVVFNWQQKEIFAQKINTGNGPVPNAVVNIRFLWGTYRGQNRGCEPSWGLCGIDIGFLHPTNDSSSGSAQILEGKLHIHINAGDVPAKYAEQIASKVIPVANNIQLSPEICKQLGVCSYTINAGNYNFTSCCDGYSFIF